ncbi:hypothetical protein PCC7424_2050 [Gloeothece citriformis PCC 7424]|uniref:Uncharacterized protein n=1 Tax=Gloeothece citriformis (strain PCC 7424) TaxID=65393 RepID=B7KF22_GLOC7|nr:hypothetical protein [Gloeothece citriformis]ACK70478.1 hypothetical protein PCC7424_2050 [Gloeothece citriformis PCC 7424]
MKIKFLPSKTFFSLAILFTLIFIAWGDQIFPKPISDYSRNTRNKLEQRILGIFSNTKSIRNKREEQLKEIDQKAQ